MLKFRIAKLEDVEEKFRGLYKPVDSADETKGFELQVEGVVAVERARELQAKIAEFRKTNVASAELLKVFAAASSIELESGLTPAELTALLEEKAEDAKKGGQGRAKDVEAEVAKRTEALKKAHETELAKARGEAAGYLNRLSALEIDSAVVTEANRIGIAEGAAVDITARARTVFKYKGGKVVAEGPDGDPVYGKDAVTPLTISEWVNSLSQAKEGKHLFAPNSGGGAAGGSAGGAGRSGGPNPFKKETWSLTKQALLMKQDPTTARRLASEAGVTVPI